MSTIAAVIGRVFLAVIFILSGVQKLLDPGPAAAMLASTNLPPSLARVVEQLLCLAQLDSEIAYEVGKVDAHACAVEIARDLAPRALARQQNLSAVTP